jgi:mutator protein MutT
MTTTVVVKAVIFNEDRHILLLTRSASHPTLAGEFDLPGGQVDEGEDLIEAVVREIQEETGIMLRTTDPQAFYSHTGTYKGQNFIRILFAITLAEPQNVLLSYEHDSFEWVTTKQATDKLPPRVWAEGIRYALDNDLF